MTVRYCVVLAGQVGARHKAHAMNLRANTVCLGADARAQPERRRTRWQVQVRRSHEDVVRYERGGEARLHGRLQGADGNHVCPREFQDPHRAPILLVTLLRFATMPMTLLEHGATLQAKVARGEISTVPARLLPHAPLAIEAAVEAAVSPPEADGAAPSPTKKKKKRKVLLTSESHGLVTTSYAGHGRRAHTLASTSGNATWSKGVCVNGCAPSVVPHNRRICLSRWRTTMRRCPRLLLCRQQLEKGHSTRLRREKRRRCAWLRHAWHQHDQSIVVQCHNVFASHRCQVRLHRACMRVVGQVTACFVECQLGAMTELARACAEKEEKEALRSPSACAGRVLNCLLTPLPNENLICCFDVGWHDTASCGASPSALPCFASAVYGLCCRVRRLVKVWSVLYRPSKMQLTAKSTLQRIHRLPCACWRHDRKR